MKKLLILLFSILISFNSYGFFGLFEKTVCVETDLQNIDGILYLPNKTKPFTGKDVCKDEDGQIITEGKVEKGKLVSQTIYDYYRYGEKKSEVNYKDDELDGKWTQWHEGKKKVEGKYKNGKEHGKWTEWYGDGQIWSEGNYKDGKYDGKVTSWYRNGQKWFEVNYKDGKYDGKATKWYRNGQKWHEATFKDDKCNSGDCDAF